MLMWKTLKEKNKNNQEEETSIKFERESFSKQSSAAEISYKEKHQSCSFCKIFGAILKIDQERNQTNGTEDKKADDD